MTQDLAALVAKLRKGHGMKVGDLFEAADALEAQAAEIARLNKQWEDHDAAWSERVAALTAALAEANHSAITKIAEATEARMKAEARIERLSSYLASCIAMIEHAIGPGRDVFIEPDTKRRLSDARAALEDGE